VIWRNLSFGTQSAAGSRFVETMLTAIETCRQQNTSVFDFVTQAVAAHFAHRPAPSLLSRVNGYGREEYSSGVAPTIRIGPNDLQSNAFG
jgi:hypothetical protein